MKPNCSRTDVLLICVCLAYCTQPFQLFKKTGLLFVIKLDLNLYTVV
jgi:hypothetical protein